VGWHQKCQQVDDITAHQITAAIEAGLAQKALTKTESDNADPYIEYQTAIGLQKQWNGYSNGRGYGPRLGSGGMATATSETFTPVNDRLVWRGTVSKTIDPTAEPEKRQKNLDKAIAKLLKNYPPQKEVARNHQFT
jgi:hypothetical protein